MHLTSQTWNKEGTFLFDYENEDYKVSNHIIKNNSYIMKKNNDIKIIKVSNMKNINIKNKADYIGIISIKQKEQFFWDYNNYFDKDHFIKPYDCLDWIVIGPTQFCTTYSESERKFEGSYKLSEGDLIKLGKIIFLIRKIKIKKNDIKKNKIKKNDLSSSNSINNSSNISNSNIDMNLDDKYNNNINEELVINIYNNKNIDYNDDDLLSSIKTQKELKNKNKEKDNTNKKEIFKDNFKDNNLLYDTVNNKLKYLYLKLKDINEKKLKQLKCRVCFCEGNFEGKNPLISPCNCTGSVKYIHLNCLRKWLTSKLCMKSSSSNNMYCYSFKSLECEICKSIIPEQVEYRGKLISLLEFKDIEPPYLVLQTMNQYNPQNRNLEYNVIFVMSFKLKNFLIIGRANNSDIRLSDISVSRNHSVISYDNGEFFIDDIGSKFGTLLLIQNNILFLPYKEISIQTGKSHLVFYLIRTFLGCFKCYKNKYFENLSYEEYFNNHKKKVYYQILQNINNNIIDPIEKFSNISNSNSNISDFYENSIFNNNDKENEDKKNDNNININNNIDDIIKINSIISNKKQIENDIINNINVDKRPTLNLNINNNGSFIIKKLSNSLNKENNNIYNSIQKQNESNEMLFQSINNKNEDNNNKYNNIDNNLTVMDILKNKNKERKKNNRPASVLTNKFYNILNLNFYSSSLINKKTKKKKISYTQRNNNKSNKINEDNKSSI